MKTLSLVIFFSWSAFAGDPTAVDALKIACGSDAVKFNVKSSEGRPPAPQPEPGKALVYVVEQYERPGNELGTPTVRVGLDGSWVGANRGTSHLFFPVEAGNRLLSGLARACHLIASQQSRAKPITSGRVSWNTALRVGPSISTR